MKKLIVAAVLAIIPLTYACYREDDIQHAPTNLQYRIHKFVQDKRIANAIMHTKYPKTLAAIAKVESEFNPKAVGDSGASYGLFQIQGKEWGRVPKDIEGQTRLAETILESLIEKHGYAKGLERWNGQGRDARNYQRRVLRLVAQI